MEIVTDRCTPSITGLCAACFAFVSGRNPQSLCQRGRPPPVVAVSAAAAAAAGGDEQRPGPVLLPASPSATPAHNSGMLNTLPAD